MSFAPNSFFDTVLLGHPQFKSISSYLYSLHISAAFASDSASQRATPPAHRGRSLERGERRGASASAEEEMRRRSTAPHAHRERGAEESATSVVVDIGGDITARGEAVEVMIANPGESADNGAPLAQIRLKDQTVATSGNYLRGFQVAGERVGHVLDPRTGKLSRLVDLDEACSKFTCEGSFLRNL